MEPTRALPLPFWGNAFLEVPLTCPSVFVDSVPAARQLSSYFKHLKYWVIISDGISDCAESQKDKTGISDCAESQKEKTGISDCAESQKDTQKRYVRHHT